MVDFCRFLLSSLTVYSLVCPLASAQSLDEITEPTIVPAERAEPLAGTAKLEMTGDIASQLVEGVDKFLLRKLADSPKGREKYWKRDFSSPEAYTKSVEPNRQRLAKMIGLVEERTKNPAIEVISQHREPIQIGQSKFVDAFAVRWHVFGGIYGEGILLSPGERHVKGRIVAIPDCDQAPEVIAGLAEGDSEAWALWLAQHGAEVVIPTLIGRTVSARNGRAVTTDREFIYRSSFELGSHPLGYDVAKVQALIDAWKAKDAAAPIGVAGHGEGGLIALLAGAIDTRIDATLPSGIFGPRETAWNEPLDRNLFGFLREFGCAELVAMIAPRKVDIHGAEIVESELHQFPSGKGGAPFELKAVSTQTFSDEFERMRPLAPLKLFDGWLGAVTSSKSGSIISPYLTFPDSLNGFWKRLGRSEKSPVVEESMTPLRALEPIDSRVKRQMDQIIAHNQQQLMESSSKRKDFFKSLKTDSLDNFKQTIEPYRKHFEEETIGKFDDEFLPLHPRTRLAYETDKWKAYEVVLDVFPDVIAYGLLILPKDLKEGEKRPVVVCQHGLEGRPQDLIGKKGFDAYKAFAGRLAERGFITFAPQNLYLFGDRFRTLQRKANPLGKTLFSVIVPQHKQIVKWLGEQNFVDKERIAFYGLSYGGKSAMRIPPLVPEYCLSICSADFNDWVWKNASTTSPYSYVWTNEYEIFEWDLGSTFNYAEMAALIAPRPFMVERGHFDGVAPDEAVAYEFAKVKHLYHAQLKLPDDHCQIEFFVGPHTINGKGTFEFLHRHLNWPPR